MSQILINTLDLWKKLNNNNIFYYIYSATISVFKRKKKILKYQNVVKLLLEILTNFI